jgi:hypothetical protein
MNNIKYKSSAYIYSSGNVKTGKIDVTYASIKGTCPESCSLKNNGCYAQLSFVGIVSRRLDKLASKKPENNAKHEAHVIKSSYLGSKIPKNTILRMHVSGDIYNIKSAMILNNAVKLWKKRGGLVAYSYTHNWANIPRQLLSNISILASIEKNSDIKEVRHFGYAPAIVVDKFDSPKAFLLEGVKFIPCPAQIKKVTCEKCKLCMKADWLYSQNMGIAFLAHGAKKNSLKKHLNVIQ